MQERRQLIDYKFSDRRSLQGRRAEEQEPQLWRVLIVIFVALCIASFAGGMIHG